MTNSSKRAVAIILIGLFVQDAVAQASPPNPRTINIRKDTALKFKTLDPLESATAKAGDKVRLRLDKPLMVDGASLLQPGYLAYGRVTKVERAGPKGHFGDVKWKLDRIYFADASVAKAKIWFEQPGDVKVADKYYDMYAGSDGLTNGEAVGLLIFTIIFSPVLLIQWLLKKDDRQGTEYQLPVGSTVAVVITKDHRVQHCSCQP